MSKKRSPFQQYLQSSRTLHYGLTLTLPVLVLYELGIFFLFRGSYYELRNTGEVLLRHVFDTLGLTNIYILSALLTLIFLIVVIRGYRQERRVGIQANYVLYMLLESVFWGGLLYGVMLAYTQLPLQMVGLADKLANINLALGAGIFEELIFRMILITALLVILQKGLGFQTRSSEMLAIVISAIVFAGFHLFMEPFHFLIFMQRVVGGLFLGYLYQHRGYGISVYTHIIFNLLILAETW